MSCIYDNDSPCEFDTEMCRNCFKMDNLEQDIDLMRDLEREEKLYG